MLLWLVAQRLYQEYFLQLHDPYSDEIFSYRNTAFDEGGGIAQASDPKMDRIEAVFRQWVLSAEPSQAPLREVFVLPNNIVTIELFPSVVPSTIERLAMKIENSSIEAGTRILIVYQESQQEDSSDVFARDEEAARELKKQVLTWLDGRCDRAVAVVCPTLKHGTRIIDQGSQVDPELYTVALVDSAYKNNEHSRIAKFASGSAEILAKSQEKKGGGKGKRAAEMRKEAERQAEEKVKENPNTIILRQNTITQNAN